MNRRDFLERTAAVLGAAAITQKFPETEAEFPPPTTVFNKQIDGQLLANYKPPAVASTGDLWMSSPEGKIYIFPAGRFGRWMAVEHV